MTVRLARRTGATLAELLVAIALLGIVGTAAATAIRIQGGVQRRVASRAAAAGQAREALAPLTADLALASAAGGDIPGGGATDSTLDLRATVAAGHVCATVPDDPRLLWLELVTVRGTGPSVGDSLAVYDGGETWPTHAIVAVSPAGPAASPCAGIEPGARVVRVVVDSIARPVAAGTPVRALRPVRYALYRGGDDATWLGLREWSSASGRLAAVQPIAGPFERASSGFTYLGAAGGELPAPVARTADVAAVVVRLTAPARGDQPARTDSLAVATRNRE